MTGTTGTILFVRHGATAATRQARFAGMTDSSLSAEGRQQAAGLAAAVAGFAPQVCYTSPLLRCRQTASLLSAAGHPPVELLAGLQEMDFGSWEGKTYREIARADQAGLDRMLRFDRGYAPGGGSEKLGGFMSRVRQTLRTITAEPAERALVVTHGGVIRAALCVLLDLNPRRHFHSFEIAPAGMAEILVFDGGAVLRRLSPTLKEQEVLQ
ncbi:MAG: histidine phosphatase family protein [Verrucomicrobiales bacterium]|nr:histidine phosphatase family protein [Verrucomicrobiota bacterium JB025]